MDVSSYCHCLMQSIHGLLHALSGSGWRYGSVDQYLTRNVMMATLKSRRLAKDVYILKFKNLLCWTRCFEHDA